MKVVLSDDLGSPSPNGYTLAEILVAVSIILILAAGSTVGFTRYIRKSSGAESSQEVTFLATAVQQYIANTGNQPATIAALATTGYTPNTKTGVGVCTNWSNGADTQGGYMLRVYTKKQDGTVDETRPQHLFDSKTMRVPVVADQTAIVGKFCGGEPGYTWPVGGSDNLIPAS